MDLEGISIIAQIATGTMILETDDFAKCAAFQMAWAEVCDMTVKPVMTDVQAREAIQTYFM
jgi:hypothetical protein